MGLLIILLISIYTVLGYILLNRSAVFYNGLLKVIIGFFLSVSLITLFFFLAVFFKVPFVVFLVFSFVFGISVATLVVYKNKGILKPSSKLKFSPWYVVISVFLFIYTYRFHFDRWGSWDAWAIWNLHAKFLLGDNFFSLFSKNMVWSHLDYPLLLPSIVALLWKGFGISAIIPALVAYAFSALIPLSSFASLREKKQVIPAILVLIIYLMDSEFALLASQQYADTILSLSILLTFIAYNHLQDKKDAKYGIAVMGFLAATCGWVKNEGLLFFLVFTIFFVASNFRKFNSLKYYFLGALFPVIVIMLFKVFCSPANDIVSGQGESTVHKLFDINRYDITVTYFWNLLLNSYPLMLLFIVLYLVFNRRVLISFQFGVLITLLAGYFMIYIITPNELNWHLATSCTRLFHHIYPCFIYCMLYQLKSESFLISE